MTDEEDFEDLKRIWEDMADVLDSYPLSPSIHREIPAPLDVSKGLTNGLRPDNARRNRYEKARRN